MAATEIYGPYKSVHKRTIIRLPVAAASSDISVNDVLTSDGSGYVLKASAGSAALAGVAATAVDSPAADGEAFVECDISEETVYAYPPDTGSVTATMARTTMDLGGAQTIDIDASTDDVVWVHHVDVSKNLLFVSFKTKTSYPGVV